MKIAPWRLPRLLAGVALFMGGPRHPSPHLDLPFRESTALMLADGAWVPSHLWMLISFVLLLVGLALWQRQPGLPSGTRRWMKFALLAVGLAALEMAFHTASGDALMSLETSTCLITRRIVREAKYGPGRWVMTSRSNPTTRAGRA